MNEAHRLRLDPIATPDRLLLGPGPSNADPRVLQAIARPPLSHLDPLYLELMNEVQEMLRYAWQTDNRFTIPVSGTGSAAMEATIANTVEPGETVVVGVIGYFGMVATTANAIDATPPDEAPAARSRFQDAPAFTPAEEPSPLDESLRSVMDHIASQFKLWPATMELISFASRMRCWSRWSASKEKCRTFV